MKGLFLYGLGFVLLGTCAHTGTQTLADASSVHVEVIADELPDGEVVLEWDKTLHDFGDISADDGPLTCTFTLTNRGETPVAIYEVASSCGCTDVKWTRETLQKGQSGSISATYKNEDGPLPFDKILTVYLTGVRRPVILRLRGVVHEKKKSLSELYGAQKLGDLGFKTRRFQSGHLKQGLSASESATVANLGKRAIEVTFTDISEGLSLSIAPNPIPAGSTATLSYTVSARPEEYGRNVYKATPVIDGKKADAPIEITAWTQENFAAWTERERADGAVPVFESSTVNFGTVEAGKTVEIVFRCTNRGKTPLRFLKADAEIPQLSLNGHLPVLQPEEKGSLRLRLDTSSLEKGEAVYMLSLTTNAPLRPLINLFVAGEIR